VRNEERKKKKEIPVREIQVKSEKRREEKEERDSC
jgi:hypothetical protein